MHPAIYRRLRLAATFYVVIGGFYLISGLPFFWIDTPFGFLRFVFWYSAFASVFFGILNRRRERLDRSG